MIEKNKEYIVNIIDQGFQGEGIAKIDNFTIFIPNVLEKETVKIKILKVNVTHAFAKAIELIEKSPMRKKEDCETYIKCGGCHLRHINYEETLRMKQKIVENNLKKQGLTNIKVKECIGMRVPVHYRNKLQYPIQENDNGEIVMGVYRQRSHEIIKTTSCKIQNEKSQEIANAVYKFIKQNHLSVYQEKKKKGNIRHIIIRAGVKTNQYMVTIVTREKELEQKEELVKSLTKEFPEIKTITLNINPQNTNVILGKENIVIWGDGYIFDELLGFSFKISPMSFYQINPYQTEVLYSKAIEYAGLTGKEIVFDLYCGIGSIGICASKSAKKIYGIETIKEAIEDAKENAKLNSLSNTEFFVGDVENKLPEFLKEHQILPDCVFIDPPRKGCEKIVLDTLIAIRPQKIVYISCNPATLARDLKILSDVYVIEELTPVDMFAWTSHVECVSVLKLKETIEK